MKGKLWILAACLASLALPETAEACGGGGIVSTVEAHAGIEILRTEMPELLAV